MGDPRQPAALDSPFPGPEWTIICSPHGGGAHRPLGGGRVSKGVCPPPGQRTERDQKEPQFQPQIWLELPGWSGGPRETPLSGGLGWGPPAPSSISLFFQSPFLSLSPCPCVSPLSSHCLCLLKPRTTQGGVCVLLKTPPRRPHPALLFTLAPAPRLPCSTPGLGWRVSGWLPLPHIIFGASPVN